MPVKRKASRHLFVVRFTEGLATRNRLPLDHVVRVLNEIRGLFESVGQQIQRERGASEATGDFGLEVVGGFKKGSFLATLAITKDVQIGSIVAARIIETVNQISKEAKGPSRSRAARSKKTAAPLLRTDYDPRVMSRIRNIGKVQEIDKTRMDLAFVATGHRPKRAVMDRRSVEVVAKLKDANFAIDELTVYGKLRALRDKYDDDDTSKKVFFGELIADDGTAWRIEFRPSDVERASSLFRRQVFITGEAVYYRALAPKIVAKDFGPDEVRDYEAAFDAIYGSNPELKGVGLTKLMKELRGDDE